MFFVVALQYFFRYFVFDVAAEFLISTCLLASALLVSTLDRRGQSQNCS